MSSYSKETLKTFFQQGDVPTGQNYADFIDSCVNLVDTTAQSTAGPLVISEVITPRVSATNANFTGTLDVNATANFAGRVNASASRIIVSAITVGTMLSAVNASFTTVSANNLFIQTLSTVNLVNSAATITNLYVGNVSALNIRVANDVSASTGTVYASAMRSVNGIFQGVGVVSATGTTQATSATLSFIINRGKGIVDGTTTGFTPPGNRTGLVQYLFNEGASANLYPPTGGTINGLAANAAFSLAASAMVTIVHLTASAMAAK